MASEAYYIFPVTSYNLEEFNRRCKEMLREGFQADGPTRITSDEIGLKYSIVMKLKENNHELQEEETYVLAHSSFES